MRKLTVLVVVLVVSVGCGGPACGDTALEANSTMACEGAGASAGYCQCVSTYLYGHHSCQELRSGSLTFTNVHDACEACVPQYGGNCN